MLTNHKHIVIPPECGFAVWFHKKHQFTGFSKLAVESFVKDLPSARKIETWNLDYLRLLDYLLAAEPDSYSEMAGAVYEFYGHALGRTFLRWRDKNNHYLQDIDTIWELYPSAQFVHIVRDGRDVACSYRALQRSNIASKYAPQLPYDIKDIAVEWSANIRRIRGSFDKIGWNNVYEIRYEDLVSRPSVELGKLCDFLEEPYDAGMERYFVRNRLEQQEPVEFLQWKEKTTAGPTTSEIGKFKNELTPEMIKEFEEISAPILDLYSYAQ